MKIIIKGRANLQLDTNLLDLLEYKFESNEIVFFCDFATEDIQIGKVFHTIKTLENYVIYEGKVTLKKVTQQYHVPFELIPKGYKTISKFSFEDQKTIPEIIFQIPEIEDWYDSTKSYSIE